MSILPQHFLTRFNCCMVLFRYFSYHYLIDYFKTCICNLMVTPFRKTWRHLEVKFWYRVGKSNLSLFEQFLLFPQSSQSAIESKDAHTRERWVKLSFTPSNLQMHFDESTADNFLKHLAKEILLIMSNFSFCHNVFNTTQKKKCKL